MATTDLSLKDALVSSGHKFRKEILTMAVLSLEDSLKFMTLRKGIRGTETVGSLSSTAQIRPYRTSKDATNTSALTARELTTYLGDIVEEFDPYLIYETVYGEPISKKRVDLNIVKKIAVAMAASVSENLNYALFSAERQSNGNTTLDLFDGFDTIVTKEKTTKENTSDTNYPISAANKNIVSLEDLTESNIGDELLKFYRGISDVLKAKPVQLFLPFQIKEMYDDWHAVNYGVANFAGKEYEQTKLRGSNNLCTLVPLASMKDAKHMIITTKKNMLVGVDQLSDSERFEINKCDNPKVVQYFMTMYFGVNFESINSRDFCCAEISFPDPEDDSSNDSDNTNTNTNTNTQGS